MFNSAVITMWMFVCDIHILLPPKNVLDLSNKYMYYPPPSDYYNVVY